MNKKEITIETYNNAPEEYALKFNNLNRDKDIEEVFELCKVKDPKVFEIGCGNGRDAKKILEYTDNYLGLDMSEKFLELAKEQNLGAEFVWGDIENFEVPKNLDIVFAFASLLHSPREEFQKIIDKVYDSLNLGGLVRISLKYSKSYEEFEKVESTGVRYFYLYSKEDIKELCKGFKILKLKVNNLLGNDWLEVLLQKE